ncbi:MAG TPA: hypothetical protein VJG49_01745 [Candidatus Nanoarchaeia archaeon]|nr:hypothetical protein [Candidatus Nanoarchaeia archaeon]
MNFENSLIEGKAKKVLRNSIKASSLFKSSIQAIETAQVIPLNALVDHLLDTNNNKITKTINKDQNLPSITLEFNYKKS